MVRGLPLTIALVAAVSLIGLACDGGGPATPTATAEPSPAFTVTPLIPLTPGTDVAALPPNTLLDMASDSPVLTILSADADDLHAGGNSLARGDFNSDGVDDLLLGAPFGDGPENSREDAGEAYVIFGAGGLEGSRRTESRRRRTACLRCSAAGRTGPGPRRPRHSRVPGRC